MGPKIIMNQFKRRINIYDIREVFNLALPAIAENVLQVLLGMIDTIFIAKLGTEAVAGVGATNLLMNIYIALFTALGVGTTALVSRNIGAKNKRDAELATEQSVILAVGFGLVIGIITLFTAQRILGVLGAEEKVISYALPYFLSVAVPSIFLALMLVLSSALRGAGDTKTPMIVTFLINIINVILDYLLIFGHFGFPKLGILGAGLATSISRTIGVLLLFFFLINKTSQLDTIFRRGIHLHTEMIKKVIRIGSPATLERLVMRFGQVVYSAMIIKIGTQAYAAHNIAGSIEMLSYMPAYGFAIAASTLVGQYLGAEKPERSQRMGMLSNTLGTVFMVGMGMIFFIFARPLGLLYTQEEAVLNQVIAVLRIIALVQPALCITVVITGALQGAGETKFPMYSTLIGIWGIRVIGVYFLGIIFGMGLIGVWIAVAIDLILRGSLLLWSFKRGKWKDIKLTGENN